VPLLSLHGINQVGRPTTPGCLDAYDAINAAGGDATFFSLLLLPNDPLFPFYSRIPLSHQIDDWGTDHLMFWDASSDKVAGVKNSSNITRLAEAKSFGQPGTRARKSVEGIFL
jgi:hypothetical protein